MNQPTVLECCVDSVESALQAAAGGADRLELCANLPIGGTTPELALFHQVRKETKLRIHVLIRPRFGDFCYSAYELSIMEESIRMFRKAGADAVVFGVLSPDGSLALPAMARLIAAAGSMAVTLHRAFDMCREPFIALEEAAALGIRTILTSGQAADCLAGAALLRELYQRADGRIEILAGGGITAEAVRILLPETGITSYHMSGKIVIASPMLYRNPYVSMGLPSMSEYEIWQTSQQKVQETAAALKEVTHVFT